MQVRRWWSTVALAVGVGATMVAWGAAPPAPGAPSATLTAYVKKQAELMKTAASADEAQTLRKEAESFLNPPRGTPGPSPTEVDRYTRDLATEFQKVIDTSAAPYSSLNAVILLADVNNINTDGALRAELTNASPAIRYWAARGLSTILFNLKPVAGAYNRAADALISGVAAEKIALVRVEMARAIGATKDPGLTKAPAGLARALANEAAAFAAGPPSAAELNAAAAEMDAISELLGAGMVLPKADETALLQAAADALSFAAQQEMKGAAAGAGASGAAVDLAGSAKRLFNAAAHGVPMKLDLPGKATPADLLFGVNDFTGSESGAGAVQKVFPEVKAPARLK